MAEKISGNRLIVFVDGVEQRSDGSAGQSNQSNISRLRSLFQDGTFQDSIGRTFKQTTRYYHLPGMAPRFADKLKSRMTGGNAEQDIKLITKDICQTLETPEDELCLYGSGNGAYIVRAVAGVLHHMGLPTRTGLPRFDDLYEIALTVYKAKMEDDNRLGPQMMKALIGHTDQPPRIQLVGLFDTVKLTQTKNTHDTSFVDSVRNLRHALAFNEGRHAIEPEFIKTPETFDDKSRSFVQAYFIGNHSDMLGGTQHDGLSLYPLQWMVLESMKLGLHLTAPAKSENGIENALSLVFPQYMGNLPIIDGTEEIEWRLQLANGIPISMFDFQTTHGSGRIETKNTHVVRLGQNLNSRKVFEPNGVIGWNSEGSFGTILHPSMFCILDRYPRIRDSTRFKALKKDLAKFEEECLKENEGDLPPWLEGSELSASGVKAFRILVCGKTGVGKSTLINKVFGVEMTEESKTYDQGTHDINVAFESPSHPGLLVHDSRGWQAGSDTELELIAKFLRHRAFQKDPAQALHVIWFCVDSDVSRIEEADKKTFATIAQFSHHVPVFVVGTKKDKLVAYRKMELLENFMEKTGDFKEASKLANEEADRLADEQFDTLREQLSRVEHYKADGFCCISKDDNRGIKDLLKQTLGFIADDRVRLFCVAAQVVDVEQKIDSAISECFRLATHGVRSAMVPLPFSDMISTPTVSRLIVEHILQCFGFPKAAPEAVEEIMSRVVLGNLKPFLKVSIAQFLTVGIVATGLAIPTMGAAGLLGAAACVLCAPNAARMLLKCSCDMILILERSFRYEGKFVSVRQIEDAAKYYTSAKIKTFAGKEKLLQEHVHDEINALIPFKRVKVGWKFNKLRSDVEEVIYNHRFGKPPDYSPTRGSSIQSSVKKVELDAVETQRSSEPAELEESAQHYAELEGDTVPVELPSASSVTSPSDWRTSGSIDKTTSPIPELDSATTVTSSTESEAIKRQSTGSSYSKNTYIVEPDSMVSPMDEDLLTRGQSDLTPSKSRWRSGTWKQKMGLRKSKTLEK